ncbi:PREDICTED: uncharacterized protein LOC107173513 [Diuraphis noxia]|uniref:uncharacterized protein LOC107173513 n=1 Tax=Diuraphis noxia TaxID=143948 RepID=UPI0007638253|nr:PREDICTED: uncharacterized protein LOC107173513 [Diuraphis noxia]
MTAETFETIMRRNNTTLVAAQEGPTMMDAVTSRPGKASCKYNKNAMLILAFFAMVCLCLLSNAGAAVAHQRRAIAPATENATAPIKECHQNNPCGWAIYVPFTRRIDYFMKNTCICNPNLACLKTDDDLSVNAYVYRCKPRPVTTTEITPTTTI